MSERLVDRWPAPEGEVRCYSGQAEVRHAGWARWATRPAEVMILQVQALEPAQLVIGRCALGGDLPLTRFRIRGVANRNDHCCNSALMAIYPPVSSFSQLATDHTQ